MKPGDRVQVVSTEATIERGIASELANVDYVSEVSGSIRVLLHDGRVTFVKREEVVPLQGV